MAQSQTNDPVAHELFRTPWSSLDTAWLVVVVALGVTHALCFTTAWDDAFISFRIAEHWAQTGELAYNPGQVQPVATNFFWVVLLALGNKLTGLSAVRWAQMLGSLAGVGILATVFIAVRAWINRRAAVIAGVLCASGAAWAAWPLAGLETSWFTWMALGGVVTVWFHLHTSRRRWLLVSGLFWGLATLTRPEGALWFGLSVGVWLVYRWREWRMLLLWLGAYAVVLVPALGFQWWTFQALVPNAFYAKVHGLTNASRGWAYVKDFFQTYRLVYVLPFILPALVRADVRQARWHLGALLAGWGLWVVGVGGDFMPYHRFLSPVWPLLCIGLGWGLDQLETTLVQLKPLAQGGAKTVVVTVVAFLGLMFVLPTFVGTHHATALTWANEERDRMRVGLWLGDHFLPTDTVVLKPAGIIPYYSGLVAYDVYSLVDREAARGGTWVQENWVGHQQVNIPRLLDLRPTVVILDEHLYPTDRLPEPGGGDDAVEHAWRADARSREFTPTRAELEPGRWLQYFVRKGRP